MFHISLYNQIYPIVIAQPQSFALSLTSNQYRSNQPRKTQKKSPTSSNKAITEGNKTEAQHTALKTGLQKSLDSSNKGYEMLKKMGYEEGKPLGRGGSGITEPLSITINNNSRSRAGLGQGQRTVSGADHGVGTSMKKKQNGNKSSDCMTKLEKRSLQLRADYRDEIELLRHRLQAKPQVNHSMIIAQVTIADEPICSEVFEIIHQYLVNSLHVYKGEPFPMFHDIAHIDDEIKVVCEDDVSFDYLAKCIAALSENLDMQMKTERCSPIGSSVYWFGVQMEGLVNGSQSFLCQIKKHRFDLDPDCWIIVSQNPCPKNNKTNLQIIIDEHSAMTLIYRHYLKLFVCMQEIEFTLKGKLPLDD